MSENMKEFLDAVSNNEELEEKLSDEELENVAGGFMSVLNSTSELTLQGENKDSANFL